MSKKIFKYIRLAIMIPILIFLLYILYQTYFPKAKPEKNPKKAREMKAAKIKENYQKNRLSKTANNFYIASNYTSFFNDLPCKDGFLYLISFPRCWINLLNASYP
jgi:hypothetical protein